MQHIREKPAPGARIDYSHPLARGLVGCWLMNETGQRVFDSSPYKNHGVLSGFDSPPKQGTYGIVFDGVDDYVNVGKANSLDITGAFTIEMWVKIPTGAAVDKYLMAKHGGANAQYYIILDVNTNIVIGTTVGSLQGVGILSRDVWYHIVVGRDASSNGFIYLNGVVDKTGTLGAPSSVNTDLTFPGRTTGLFGQQSTIDEVRIYNRALSANEVKQLYINPYDIFEK